MKTTFAYIRANINAIYEKINGLLRTMLKLRYIIYRTLRRI